MKKYRLFILCTTICFLIAAAGIFVYTNYIKSYTIPDDFENNIKNVTSNAKIIDINQNHNQALDAANYAAARNINIPQILINFDTHSDIHLNLDITQNGALISDWINVYFSENQNAIELYWVMPREEALNVPLRLFFASGDSDYLDEPFALYGNSLKKINPFKFLKTPLTKHAYTQEFLLDTTNGYMMEAAPEDVYKKLKINLSLKNPKLKNIKITTCTEDTLPDFKGKDVFLSIDADYVSNSGFDTTGDFINNKNSQQIDKILYQMIKTLNDKNINPSIINLTLSPQYLPVEDYPQLENFYNKILEISKKPDALQNYKYTIDAQTLEDYEKFKTKFLPSI